MPPKASTSATKVSTAAKSSTSSDRMSGSTSNGVGAKKAASSSAPKKTAVSNGNRQSSTANGYDSPVASTSAAPMRASSSQPAPLRLTSLENLLHNAALNSPKRTILSTSLFNLEGAPADKELMGATVNSLLRKSLLNAVKTARGDMAFRAIPKQEARELAAMDPDDKMVLEQINQAGNLGIWTRSLKQKTGLHQNSISKAIKTLEQKKLIKNVKSVKHPTRKIYMIASITPSIDVTGGPWYAGNDLDTEFITALQSLSKQYIRKKSFPDGKTDLLWPQAHIPYLPTANDILEYLTDKDVLRGVELDLDHIEAILNVLVWDGEIERLWVPRYSDDGDGEEQHIFEASQFLTNGAGKKRKKNNTGDGRSTKRRRARSNSEAIDEDSQEESDSGRTKRPKEESDAESDENGQLDQHSADEDWLPPPLSGRTNGDHNRERQHKRPGPAGKDPYWVYRTSLTAIPSGQTTNAEGQAVHTFPHIYEVGFSQTPCGICPVFDFCRNRGQPKVVPLPGEKDLLSKEPSVQGGGAPIVSLNDVVATRKKAAQRRYNDLLKMKVPAGGGDFEDADGMWKGTTKVGGTAVAPVNPASCVYYSQWFGQTIEW